ncbi:hypothetical protein RWK44_10440 [Rhizobium sp. 25PS6]|uniref:hypothetical protein n=1 Tax=Rhizobium TaxID=379 RepID=UPI00103BD931|nr:MULTISPECIES: hypothetical protein [Rhizobium]MBY3106282.1 hypothetical protein [Rhizobium laguerreae]MBY3158621.1 hypothetical protein [Rhizobium laguerreae]MBY3159273.1 hypothetical protein [Rhizobium laguerreae]MBY3220379.1 hypothetical protein [Rhizobium laguerreae]MBY3234517.1 hypothetical protein [Rhizobium laguerreae]
MLVMESTIVSTDVWHIEHRREVLELYGKVSVRWAALDLLLVGVLSIALENRPAAHDLIFNAAGSGKTRLDAFNRAIGASRFTREERAASLELTRKAADLLSARNEIIHAPLVIGLSIDGSKITPTLNKLGRQGKEQPLAVSKIEKHVKAIGDILSKLERLAESLDLKYDPIDPDDL